MEDFERQRGILDHRMAAAWPITLIGCGGIGSTIAPDLPLMGFRRFTLFDGDVVEPHNLPNQPAYTKRDMGKNKARRLARRIREKGAMSVTVRPIMFDPVLHSKLLDGIVIVAVDSMERIGEKPCGRREIWNAVKASLDRIPFYVDGRLGGEMFDCYAFAPSNFDAVRAYEQRALFKQSEAATLPCTQGAIIYATRMLGVTMQYRVAAWLRGERSPWRIAFDFKLVGNPDASPMLREFLE